MLALVLLFALGGRSGDQSDRFPTTTSVSLPAPLAAVLTRYENAWRAKDGAALAKLFAEDGYVLPSGGPMVHGRKAIQELYTGQGGPLFLHAVSYATEGNVGYIIGTFGRLPDGPDVGKFTLTLTKGRDGEWLIMSDMDNGNHR